MHPEQHSQMQFKQDKIQLLNGQYGFHTGSLRQKIERFSNEWFKNRLHLHTMPH